MICPKKKKKSTLYIIYRSLREPGGGGVKEESRKNPSKKKKPHARIYSKRKTKCNEMTTAIYKLNIPTIIVASPPDQITILCKQKLTNDKSSLNQVRQSCSRV